MAEKNRTTKKDVLNQLRKVVLEFDKANEDDQIVRKAPYGDKLKVAVEELRDLVEATTKQTKVVIAAFERANATEQVQAKVDRGWKLKRTVEKLKKLIKKN